MKYIDFDYTDRNGKTTHREALVLRQPTQFMECLDVTELELDEQAQLATEYDKIVQEMQERLLRLYNKYDVVNSFRQFVPERMNVTYAEYI